MAQTTAPQPQQIGPKGMGPGFWPYTIALTVLNVIFALLILFAPLDFIMPGWSHPVTDRAADIDGLFKFMSVFGFAIFCYVAGYVAYFAIVFRRRPGEPAGTIGVVVHDAPKLEFWWTVIPSVLLVILTGLSIVVWYKIQFGTGAPALTMEVIGHQFYFEYRYPGLKGSVYSQTDAMHLPIGKPVRILITSADVIHQFWAPEIRLKAAAVPGLVQNLNFTPTAPGTFDVACSEYCGVDHSVMQGKLVIESADKFEKWLAAQKQRAAAGAHPIPLARGNAASGKALFAQKCSACHAIAPFDKKIVGPGLAKLTDDPQHPTLVTGKSPTRDHIAEILENGYTGPIGAMPNRQANGLSDENIADLVAYLVSLK
ncbi:MAG: cytochrome c oxidase subunit II [Candidatus Eremiobacteraeota bacterium]|nr:cytochrome c oxidase subunit II [Candidatus Eremiobacteraeota bacterium]